MRSKLTLFIIAVVIGGPLIGVAYLFSLGYLTEAVIAWAVLMALVWFVVQFINGLKANNASDSDTDDER